MPSRPQRSLAAGLFGLLLSTGAHAGVVASSPLYQANPNLNQCMVANPGTNEVRVDAIQMISLIGTVIEEDTNVTIQPGRVYVLDHTGGGVTYCRVTGTSAKKIRLTHCVRETTSGSRCFSTSSGQ